MLVSSVIVLLAIGSTSVSATNYAKFNLLKDDRAAGRLVFPPTTLAQKEVILSNVESALAIWASYDSKMDHYGSAADPFPIVKKLRENIKTVANEKFHLRLTDAFARIRDHHTRWTNIAPYGCFYATTGVEFTFIEGDADIIKNPTVVVTSTAKHPVIRSLFGEDYSKIQAGDELLAINGLSFVNWFEQNKFKYGFGANAFGGQRAALEYLTTISGETNRLPSEDSITFQFKSRANPHNIYTVNVPYISIHEYECWNLGSNLYKSITSKTLPGTPEASLPVSAKQPGHNHESDTPLHSPEGHKMDSPEDPERGVAIEKMSSSSQKSAVPMNPTDVTEITWGVYKPESANMGIIKLDSFDPEDAETKSPAIEKAVMIIRSLLANELKDTKSVIDPDAYPYAKAWQETEPGSRFTNVFFLHSAETVNTLGQAYLRPMGVFNDARCYSSCELFSGAIQGHDAGTIFGEDERTGGGGAIFKKLDPFLIRASPTYFKKFPFNQELTSGSITYANTLTVGVTQFVRTGRYKGQGIEDVGIKTDTVFRPQWSDLQPDPTTNTQYDRIAEHLARTGQKNGQSKLHFVCEPFSIEKPIGGFPLEVEAAGISDSVGLYQSPTTAPADGWNNLKGKWMIGNGVQYAKNIESSIEAFFTAPVGTEINIGLDIDLDTEIDCDFLYLSVKSSDGVEDFLLSSKEP
ncbi:hypothetical protein BASA62_008222 [Batrachochytrium salamandrivorans]|nr:hypothetical protein BASA62_008222 [Batrachochytrium salamandrivorans]